jgi:hypothetical protein
MVRLLISALMASDGSLVLELATETVACWLPFRQTAKSVDHGTGDQMAGGP